MKQIQIHNNNNDNDKLRDGKIRIHEDDSFVIPT